MHTALLSLASQVCFETSDNENIPEYDESNTYVLERFDTTAGNPVKKILLKIEFYLITVDPQRIRRFYTLAGNPVKEILLKLNLPDHRILKDGGEVKEPQERCNIKAFQDNISRKVFKITFSHSSQDKGTSSSLKSMITTSNHKLMIEVKDYELKTKDKA
ncbi:hypothetical protein Tco_0046063 [Tanacetum coccineum]